MTHEGSVAMWGALNLRLMMLLCREKSLRGRHGIIHADDAVVLDYFSISIRNPNSTWTSGWEDSHNLASYSLLNVDVGHFHCHEYFARGGMTQVMRIEMSLEVPPSTRCSWLTAHVQILKLYVNKIINLYNLLRKARKIY